MKEFLKYLDVRVTNEGKGRYTVRHKDKIIGSVVKCKECPSQVPWTFELLESTNYKLHYASMLDALQIMLSNIGLNITPLVSHVKLDPVILRISSPRLVHDKDLNDPSARITLLCTVVYSKPATINNSCVLTRAYFRNSIRGGAMPRWETHVDKIEKIMHSDAIIDFNEDKIILINGKELQAVNVKSMIDELRSYLSGKKE